MSTWADAAAIALCLGYSAALALACAAWTRAIVACVRILARPMIDSRSA